MANGVIVLCDTQEKIYVQVEDVSPLGVGIHMPADSPDICGREVIIVNKSCTCTRGGSPCPCSG